VPDKKAVVSIENIKRDLPGAVARVMDRHGVADSIRERPDEVYVKVNAIDFKPYVYTNVEVTGEVFGGEGGFTIVMGKGLDPVEIDAIEGRVFIAGPCAYDEVGARLITKLGKKNVLFSRECNDLAGTTGSLNKLMKVNAIKMVPISPLKSVSLLLKARMHRTTARIPPLVQF